MHSATVIIALTVLACANAGAVGIGAVAVPLDVQHHYPSYRSAYGVSNKFTGDHKSAVEVRDGHITKGSYSLLQPDGVVRTVKYVSDQGGFRAQVLNSGVAAHPNLIAHPVAIRGPPPVPCCKPIVKGLHQGLQLGLGLGLLGLGGAKLLG